MHPTSMLRAAIRRPNPVTSLWALLAVIGIAMPMGWILDRNVHRLSLALELLFGGALAAIVAGILRAAPRRLDPRTRLIVLAVVAGLATAAAGVVRDPVPLAGMWIGLAVGAATDPPTRDLCHLLLAVGGLVTLIQAVAQVMLNAGVTAGLLELGVVVGLHAVWIACNRREGSVPRRQSTAAAPPAPSATAGVTSVAPAVRRRG